MWTVHCWTWVRGKRLSTASGEPFRPVDAGYRDVLKAAIVRLGDHVHPGRRPLALADPQTKEFLRPFARHRQGEVDRRVP
jgi:hypothetical protein